ncbi:ubiquitin-related domain-containing protein [Lophiotrema nucula]|uniref:Ubiquitin-related domain-containing protein n=1 Tax=Lophiotrema nucula TaxID=690887 RepID=A0A6A5ZRD4_9PLEO|nr:ubiquitin-related domain-containing protein [Lophiotrema nucula]
MSSISSTSEVEDTMQIFVKDVSGHNTIPLTIPSSTTISTLRTMLSLRSSMPDPSSLRLVHAGKHLSSPDDTLSSYNIQPNSTLHLALPLRGGGPKKIRCSFKECKDAAQRIVGDCGFCEGHFCGKHRLLEDHKCSGLEDCKKESHERNADKLNSERTVAIRGV